MNNRLPTSKIQAMCTGDEPEFMLGEVYGLRQWELKDFGHLVGHYGNHWPLKAGHANVASCDITLVSRVLNYQVSESVSPRFALEYILKMAKHMVTRGELAGLIEPKSAELIFNRRFPGRNPFDDREVIVSLNTLEEMVASNYEITAPAPMYTDLGYSLWEAELVGARAPHTVAHPTCTCGFYAYTDWPSLHQNSNTGAASAYVFGLVRGHGHVTVGTKGFRAEKAEIVALTWPHHYEAERLFYTDQNPSNVKNVLALYAGTEHAWRGSSLDDVMSVYSDTHYAHWRQLVVDSGIPLVRSLSELEAYIASSGISLGL